MAIHKVAGLSLIYRLELENTGNVFGPLASAIGVAGGDIAAVDLIQSTRDHIVRDLKVNVYDQAHGERVTAAIKALPGVRVINVSDRVFLLHLGGKIEITPKHRVMNRDDLSMVYTPGVARVCEAVRADPYQAHRLTMKRNTVAIVTDGTAVLGLGDIGPAGALPVMEGKAALFKQFADVDAVPVCLDTKDPDEIVRIVRAMATPYGGINLEDISSPRCFYIEEKLQEELDVPVMHDDQHGTAAVVLASLINAAKVVHKELESMKVVVVGVGAAGTAVAKAVYNAGIRDIVCVDRYGIIPRGEQYPENAGWQWVAENTNPRNLRGNLSDAVRGADAFIGLSRGNILSVDDVKAMNHDPIVFAMANPTPEIDPELAAPHVAVLATGRSDYPNQVNNLLAFPGFFRGLLDCRARRLNAEMKLAAARAIAAVVQPEELNAEYIIPSVFNRKVVDSVSQGVMEAAYATGVARRRRREFEAMRPRSYSDR